MGLSLLFVVHSKKKEVVNCIVKLYILIVVNCIVKLYIFVVVNCTVKAISITYYECMPVALVIQLSKRLCPIMLPSVACTLLPYFSTLSHKRQDSWKKTIEHKMFVVVSSVNFG